MIETKAGRGEPMSEEFNRNESVLLALLSRLDGWTVRTKVVKLAYMMDNEMFGQAGVRATEFDYIWDNYGPNDGSNSIVKTLDNLIGRNVVQYTRSLHELGGLTHHYRVDPRIAPSLHLTADDWVFVQMTVNKWGGKTARELATESKTTLPFKNASPGDQLEFVRDPAVVSRLRDLMEKHGEFIKARAAEASTIPAGDYGVRWDELQSSSAE